MAFTYLSDWHRAICGALVVRLGFQAQQLSGKGLAKLRHA